MPRSDDTDLVKLLDQFIEENELELALKTLRETRDSFSRHDEYLEKVGKKIK